MHWVGIRTIRLLVIKNNKKEVKLKHTYYILIFIKNENIKRHLGNTY